MGFCLCMIERKGRGGRETTMRQVYIFETEGGWLSQGSSAHNVRGEAFERILKNMFLSSFGFFSSQER